MSEHCKIEVSIVLPTFNEKENVALAVDAITKNLEGVSFEIIIVDDDSPDLTWRVAQSLSEEKNNLKVIRRLDKNKSLSGSVVDGFASSRGKYLICMDCDLQHDPVVLIQFIELFRLGKDIVVGTRNNDEGGIENWSIIRQVTSWVATKMAHLFLKTQTTDPMSGFFGVKREYFEEIYNAINPRGYKILLEFLARAKNKTLGEVGFIFKSRQFGKSKLSSSVIFDYCISLYELGIGPYVSLQFLMYAMVAFTGVIVNQGSLWVLKEFLETTPQVALMVAIELSIISNYTLNNMWTFKNYKFRGVGNYLKGLLSFNSICIAGAYINYSATFYSVENIMGNIYLANFIGIALACFWNYLINSNLTWKKN